MKGRVQWVLHAHLPYVCHDDLAYCLEHDWFFEALTETYIPLLILLQKLDVRAYRHVLTLSLSPPLLRMMQEDLLLEQYEAYLDEHIALAEDYAQRHAQKSEATKLAQHYLDHYLRVRDGWVSLGRGGLVQAWGDLARKGVLALITTSESHAYLPLWNDQPELVQQQISQGCAVFEQAFGFNSRGFWLPECGYVPGFEQYLHSIGVEYFFLETHGILQAYPQPRRGVFHPVRCANDVMAWGRDATSSKWIWSATEGYPGSGVYRDFYCDIGFDETSSCLQNYQAKRGGITATGFKHRRVGFKEDFPSLYRPSEGQTLVREHALLFMDQLRQRVDHIQAAGVPQPCMTLCFDAELFGHWWWEGLWFLERVWDSLDKDDLLVLSTPEQYGPEWGDCEMVQPALSSWGQGGYHRRWLNPNNDWVWRELKALWAHYQHGSWDQSIHQACEVHWREVLSSDWIFMMATGQSEMYARTRLKSHLDALREWMGLI